MKCPCCNIGELYYAQTAEIKYSLLDDASINKEVEIIGTDFSWIECSHCDETNESHKALRDVYSNDFDTSMSEAL